MDKALTETTASWSIGWYVFEDGKVLGPLRAEETFAKSPETATGAQRMVSRKGFAQWYPLKDFAELHNLAGKYAHQVAEEQTAIAQNSVRSQFAKTEPKAKTVAASIKAQPSVTQKLDLAPMHMTAAEASAKASRSVQSAPMTRKERRRQKKLAEQAKNEKTQTQRQVSRAAQASIPPRAVSFDAQYLLVAARLRLGRIRNPWLGSYVFTPLTLFGYWGAWMLRAGEEVTWHLAGTTQVKLPMPLWAAMIPGLHLYVAWMLAKIICEMEKQNGYQTVSPLPAALLAIFPPFYILHIQGALNRHWRLHVQHSLQTSNR